MRASFRNSRGLRAGFFAAACAIVAFTDTANADDSSGALSPTRLKLPRGPGSLEGVGENAEANLNMGFATYAVPLAVPSGQQGVTPSLGLRYSSNGGAGVVGLGWSLGGIPTIERMTSRGLPSFDSTDLFATDSGSELTQVTGGTSGQRVYRERMEASFSRYTWVDASGNGQAGYWKVESADGRVSYFGARADGTAVPEARLLGRGGAVFAYYLAETVDPFGHRVVYDYALDGGRPYLATVSWGFESFAANASARYVAELTYEPRGDVLTDAKPGVVVRLAQRLSSVRVRVSGAQLRRYALSYEPMNVSGGLSRLSSVTTFGTDDVTSNPIVHSFGYSRGLDPTCMNGSSSSCARPYRRGVGSVGVDFRTNDADFVDMNGDALPDVLNTAGGVHRIHLQTLDATMAASFAPVMTSSMAGSGSAILSSPEVELLDLDGDGRTDLVDRLNQRVLRNAGATGDWTSAELLDTHMPALSADTDLRFLDVDYDRQTDAIHLNSSGAWYFRNSSGGIFATSSTAIAGLGRGFTSDGLRLADMNGDGMSDAVQFVAGSLWYFANLGMGEFEPTATVMTGLPSGWTSATTDLVDVSGDGLVDLVQVVGSVVQFALNRDASSFGAVITVQGSNVDGGLPTRDPTTSMRYVDMNANGTTDVVYVSSSGLVEYVELYPERPNLLVQIGNGIGRQIGLEYGPLSAHMARNGGLGAASGWAHTPPHPMVVLNAITVTETRTYVVQRQEFRYRSGYWDSQEHQFRGFESVLQTTPGDAHVETGAVEHTFDVGVMDRYHRGLALRTETRSDGRVLTAVTNEWTDCAVAQAMSATSLPVRYVCSQRNYTDIVEGLSAAETVRTEEDYQYDGYGNRIATHKLGVVSRGGQACGACTRDTSTIQGEPCGAICVGDETHELVDFIAPGASTNGRWMLRLPYRKRTFGIEGSAEIGEQRFYYDGVDFVGAPLGTADRGTVRREEARRVVGADSWLPSQRYAVDSHGNVVKTMDPNGHSRTFVFDGAGLLVLREESELQDAGHAPYNLRMDVEYDPILEAVSQSTAWMRVDGISASSPRVSRYAYDPLARLTAIAEPGDDLVTPTQEFAYDLGSPVSRIVTRRRSVAGAAIADLESIQCFDGLGRKFEERVRLEPTRYQVVERREFDVVGGVAIRWYPSFGVDATCSSPAAPGTLRDETRRDAMSRPVEIELGDALENGGVASVQRRTYRPLETTFSDENDTDASHEYAATPTRLGTDGLSRVIRRERTTSADGTSIVQRVEYDALGRIRSLFDDLGNARTQRRDLLGRIVEVSDPDAGTSTYTHDDAGNVTSRTDARGVVTVHEYDELNRVVRSWDSSNELETQVTYAYDGRCSVAGECANGEGALVEIEYPLLDGERGRERTARDGRGRDVARVVERGTRRYELTAAYDNANRPVERQFPDGTRLSFQLDGAGRLTSVPGYVHEVAYDDRGHAARIALGNGVVETRGFDSRLRLTHALVALPDGTQGRSVSYEWDRVGNLLRVDDALAVTRGTTSEAAEYSYDSLDRVSLARLGLDGDRDEFVHYTYDTIDNLTSIESSSGSLSAAHVGAIGYGTAGTGPHRAVTAGAERYEYDNAGQLVERLGQRYDWDYLGRLASVTSVANGAVESRNAFGVDWTRVQHASRGHATEYVSEDYEIRDGIGTIWIRSGDTTFARIEVAAPSTRELPDLAPATVSSGNALSPAPDGRISAADAWLLHATVQGLLPAPSGPTIRGPQVDSDVAMAAAARRRLMPPDGRSSTFEHADSLGSTALETDESGSIIRRVGWYPFGQGRFDTSDGTLARGYTGAERDSSTSLSLHGARWLDPRVGRWITPDPLYSTLGTIAPDRLPEAASVYAYSANNPVAFLDPSGERTVMGADSTEADRTAVLAQLQAMSRDRLAWQQTQSGEFELMIEHVGRGRRWNEGTALVREAISASATIAIEYHAGADGRASTSMSGPLRAGGGYDSRISLFERTIGSSSVPTEGRLPGGYVAPAFITLAHELAHGVLYSQGLAWSGCMVSPARLPDGSATNEVVEFHEWAATQRENAIRREHPRIPLREQYHPRASVERGVDPTSDPRNALVPSCISPPGGVP